MRHTSYTIHHTATHHTSHHTPYTIHHTPYTIHHTPYTIHHMYSYNGIIFDVEARGPFEVTVQSISIAGMLGRVVGYPLSLPTHLPFPLTPQI
ncbi:hypothetical protein EON63_14990, partial [archaeon]